MISRYKLYRDVVHIKLIWPAADVLFKSQNYDAYFDEIPDNFFRYFVQSSSMKPSETISLNDLLGSNGIIEIQRIPADKKFFKLSGLKLIVEILKC